MSLPVEVVVRDHDLEDAASRADGALLAHRWHWTLDESNPQRVSCSEYARAVGRDQAAINRDAHAYLIASTSGRSMDESRSLARMSAETGAAADAVAKARGVTVQNVHNKRMDETRRVRDIARDRAEKHGTSIEEEAPQIAEQIVRQEQADARLAEERKAKLGLRFVKTENILAAMYRKGSEALAEMRDVPWEDEHRELLISALGNIKAVLNLIDMALTGAADVDWDAELAKLR